MKGEQAADANIVGGPQHSTLSNDAFGDHTFDFMLSNPPYGKSWKTDLDRMGGRSGMTDPRFVIQHGNDPEYSLATRVNDGQMMFLANMVSKMKADTPLGSRIAEVHNGSSLFTGDAGQGESNVRRWIIENDWLEAIVALPLNMFYNTGIATCVWALTNRKAKRRQGYVQLIDLHGLFPATVKGEPVVVEYEPDPDLRDTEQVPLLEDGGVDAFLLREALPYAHDAWYTPSSVKTGYEINFNRHFYQPQPMRPLEEIRADILALERETEGLLGQVLGD